MGIFYSYCTICNNELKYFIEYKNDGIECDVCSHFNTDKEVKGTWFKYGNGYMPTLKSSPMVSSGALRIWGEKEMKKENKMKRKIKHNI